LSFLHRGCSITILLLSKNREIGGFGHFHRAFDSIAPKLDLRYGTPCNWSKKWTIILFFKKSFKNGYCQKYSLNSTLHATIGICVAWKIFGVLQPGRRALGWGFGGGNQKTLPEKHPLETSSKKLKNYFLYGNTNQIVPGNMG